MSDELVRAVSNHLRNKTPENLVRTAATRKQQQWVNDGRSAAVARAAQALFNTIVAEADTAKPATNFSTRRTVSIAAASSVTPDGFCCCA
jgi:hypothetical protein